MTDEAATEEEIVRLTVINEAIAEEEIGGPVLTGEAAEENNEGTS